VVPGAAAMLEVEAMLKVEAEMEVGVVLEVADHQTDLFRDICNESGSRSRGR
jgi:hypothetical protein